MLSFYGKFGVNSASLRSVISCLVSVRNSLCKGVDSFDVSVEQLLLLCCFDFVSLASVLVVFSQRVNSSPLVAQSLSSSEIATRDALVSCHCVEFFLH